MSEVAFGVYRDQTAAGLSPARQLAPKLRTEVHPMEDSVVVCCFGRIVFRDEALTLSSTLAEWIGRTRRVIIDLQGVEMVDSAGLGELVFVRTRALAQDCTLRLAAPRKIVRRVLDITNLASVFEVFPSVEEALIAGCSRPV